MSDGVTRVTIPRTESYMSEAIRSGNVIAVSGQVAYDESGNLVGPGDYSAQAEQCFRNIEKLLHRAGASFTDLLKVTAFIASPEGMSDYLEVRKRWFAHGAPASTTIVASTIAPGTLIEINALAVCNATA